MKNTCLIILSLFVGAGMVSCDHKNLDYDGSGTADLRIVFDWSKAPDANPQSVVAYLFPVSDETDALRYNFSGRDGGRAYVPENRYIGIGLNSDITDWARFRNTEKTELFEVYTDDAQTLTTFGLDTRSIPRKAEAEGERMAAAVSSEVWSDKQDEVNVESYLKDQEIVLYPEEITCHYTIKVNGVKNINYLKGGNLDATLSGLSESYFIGGKSTSKIPATMPVVLRQDGRENSVFGSFINFGDTSEDTRRHILTIYLVYEDKTGSYATFDVTDQVHNAPDPHHVDIVVNGLELPQPIASGGGLVPNVNDWNSVDYTLEM